jgi:hypothetical protein
MDDRPLTSCSSGKTEGLRFAVTEKICHSASAGTTKLPFRKLNSVLCQQIVARLTDFLLAIEWAAANTARAAARWRVCASDVGDSSKLKQFRSNHGNSMKVASGQVD